MYPTTCLLLQVVLVLLSIINYTNSTFIYNKKCDVNSDNLKLRPFIIDAAVDEKHQKLKFFINSQVANMRRNYSNNYTNIVIDDVNFHTNKYTTFHVEIDFMGKVITKENKRFCDMIAVKNTTDFRNSPRFQSKNSTENDTQEISMTDPFSNLGYNDTILSKRTFLPQLDSTVFSNKSILLSQTNYTIERIFNNSTGKLVKCPLYYNDSILLYYEADISHHFHRLGSYEVKFTVVSNDEDSQIIGCSRSFITPVQPDIVSGIVAYGVLVLLSVTVVVNILTMSYSTYQESSNPFLYKASTICNLALLKQVDASLPRIIGYLQYAFFIGGLDLAYPGFYQPIIGKIKWCALLGFAFVSDSTKVHKKFLDNLYLTLDSGGLSGLTKFSSSNPVLTNWANFMITLIIITSITIVFNQAFFVFKIFLEKVKLLKFHNKPTKDTDNFQGFSIFSRKNLYLILGQALHCFLIIFGMPFLILTTFQFLAAGDINGKHRFFSNYEKLKYDAYSLEVPYDALVIPSSVFEFSSQIGIEPIDDKIGQQTSYGVFYRSVADDNNFRWNYDPANTTMGTESGIGAPFNSTSMPPHPPFMYISEACIVLASISLFVWLCLCGYFIFHYLLALRRHFRLRQSSNVSKLYTSLKTILIWAFLYHEYRPTRVNFVIYDMFSLLLKLFVIGLLQNYGVVQVILLIVITVVDLFLLFIYRPYFVKISWWSLKVMFPVARFLISMLCIPFIRGLDINESSKTYVAYVQLLISAIVVVIFSIQLLYWFLKTCILIFIKVRSHRKSDTALTHHLTSDDSLEEFHRQFQYKPLQPPPSYKTQVQAVANNNCGMSDDDDNDDNDEYSPRLVVADETELEDEDYYYRKKSEIILKNLASENEIQAVVSNSSESNFQQQQNESNLRRIQNDYKVREGDQIYKKYFTDDLIDPEVKELWESRKEKLNVDDIPEYTTPLNKLKGFIKAKSNRNNNKPNDEVGFHINRPKKLVVKTMQQIREEEEQQQQRQKEEEEEEGEMYPSSSSTNLI